MHAIVARSADELVWQQVPDVVPDRAEVLVKGKRVRCRAGELVPGDGAGSAAAGAGGGTRGAGEASRTSFGRGPGALRRAGRGRDLDESVSIAPEINLIGKRVEPALVELDGYLDQALLAARPEVRVVHGHGTGRLRQAVRSHLRAHPAVAALRAGADNEGGDGATVVKLRGA